MEQKPQESENSPQQGTMIALCTCPSRQVAERLAHQIVEKRRAACVNIIPGVQSVYRWQGQITQDEEYLLVAKTTREGFASLSAQIVAEHPYELPEVIGVSIEQGLSAYLRWIEEEVG